LVELHCHALLSCIVVMHCRHALSSCIVVMHGHAVFFLKILSFFTLSLALSPSLSGARALSLLAFVLSPRTVSWVPLDGDARGVCLVCIQKPTPLANSERRACERASWMESTKALSLVLHEGEMKWAGRGGGWGSKDSHFSCALMMYTHTHTQK
jgi:hypothetical protein